MRHEVLKYNISFLSRALGHTTVFGTEVTQRGRGVEDFTRAPRRINKLERVKETASLRGLYS